ncbi:MAG: sigma factor, partial [Planctomycetota bacterium]
MSEVTAETLLAEKDFVRGLARSLVRDEARADDISQQAWLAAMERPPHSERAVRAWFRS